MFCIKKNPKGFKLFFDGWKLDMFIFFQDPKIIVLFFCNFLRVHPCKCRFISRWWF